MTNSEEWIVLVVAKEKADWICERACHQIVVDHHTRNVVATGVIAKGRSKRASDALQSDREEKGSNRYQHSSRQSSIE